MIIFTSICANYLHKARVLAESVKIHIPDALFIVCMVEDKKTTIMNYEYFDDIVLAKDIWIGNFNQFIFKHSIVEASTSVKGQFFRYLMTAYLNEDKFIYLDPDCKVYSDFIELREILNIHQIVLCPHLLDPGNIDMELSSITHGVYNLGFLAISRGFESYKMINWWTERLYLYCYDDIPNGIFTDQGWIDLVPCFFETYILKHNGYDFATWRIMDCKISKKDDLWFIKNQPLRFIHYSGYGVILENCMNNWLNPKGTLFRELYNEYKNQHIAANTDSVSSTSWSYDKYISGELIDLDIRNAYRKNHIIMFAIDNPFKFGNMFYILKFDMIWKLSKLEQIKLFLKKIVLILVENRFIVRIKTLLNNHKVL